MKRICVIHLSAGTRMPEIQALLRALATRYPGAVTTLVTTVEGGAACRGVVLVNELVVIDADEYCATGLQAAYARMYRFVDELRGRDFARVINLGAGRAAAIIARLINCPDMAGATFSADWMPVVRGEWPAYLAACRRNNLVPAFDPVDIMPRFAGATAPLRHPAPRDQRPPDSEVIFNAVWRAALTECLDLRPIAPETIDAAVKEARASAPSGHRRENDPQDETVNALRQLAELFRNGATQAQIFSDLCANSQTPESRQALQACAREMAAIEKRIAAQGRARPQTRPIAALFSAWMENIEAQALGEIAAQVMRNYSRAGELAQAVAGGLVRDREPDLLKSNAF
jgi:hypothetical protein